MIFNTKRMIDRLKLHFGAPITDIERMEQGYTNHVYMFSVNNKKYIYKEYTDKNETEINILKKITEPKILVNEQTYRIEEYIESEEIDYRKHMKEIVEGIKEMHSFDTSGVGGFDALIYRLYFEAVYDLIKSNVSVRENEKEKGVYSDVPYSIEQQVKTLEEIRNRTETLFNNNRHKEAFCHNDLLVHNMLKVKGKIIIIDYEFASVGDVLFDIANLFCETHYDYVDFKQDINLGYTREEEGKFLKLYFGEIDEDIWRKVDNFKIVCYVIWFLWTIPRLRQDQPIEIYFHMFAIERLDLMKKGGFISKKEYMTLKSIIETK